jgi:hypothetical protein
MPKATAKQQLGDGQASQETKDNGSAHDVPPETRTWGGGFKPGLRARKVL